MVDLVEMEVFEIVDVKIQILFIEIVSCCFSLNVLKKYIIVSSKYNFKRLKRI